MAPPLRSALMRRPLWPLGPSSMERMKSKVGAPPPPTVVYAPGPGRSRFAAIAFVPNTALGFDPPPPPNTPPPRHPLNSVGPTIQLGSSYLTPRSPAPNTSCLRLDEERRAPRPLGTGVTWSCPLADWSAQSSWVVRVRRLEPREVV